MKDNMEQHEINELMKKSGVHGEVPQGNRTFADAAIRYNYRNGWKESWNKSKEAEEQVLSPGHEPVSFIPLCYGYSFLLLDDEINPSTQRKTFIDATGVMTGEYPTVVAGKKGTDIDTRQAMRLNHVYVMMKQNKLNFPIKLGIDMDEWILVLIEGLSYHARYSGINSLQKVLSEKAKEENKLLLDYTCWLCDDENDDNIGDFQIQIMPDDAITNIARPQTEELMKILSDIPDDSTYRGKEKQKEDVNIPPPPESLASKGISPNDIPF